MKNIYKFKNFLHKNKELVFLKNYMNNILGDYQPAYTYKFDYMEDSVKLWKCKHITKDMINGLPYGITFYGTMYDMYGQEITDFEDWHKQREYFVEYLYKKYKR